MDSRTGQIFFGIAVGVIALHIYKRNYGNTVSPLYRSAGVQTKAVLASNFITDPQSYDATFNPNISNPGDNDQILNQNSKRIY